MDSEGAGEPSQTWWGTGPIALLLELSMGTGCCPGDASPPGEGLQHSCEVAHRGRWTLCTETTAQLTYVCAITAFKVSTPYAQQPRNRLTLGHSRQLGCCCLPSSSFSTLQVGCKTQARSPLVKGPGEAAPCPEGFSWAASGTGWDLVCSLGRGCILLQRGPHRKSGEAAPYPCYLFSSLWISQWKILRWGNPGPWLLPRGNCHTDLWLYMREEYLNFKCWPALPRLLAFPAQSYEEVSEHPFHPRVWKIFPLYFTHSLLSICRFVVHLETIDTTEVT